VTGLALGLLAGVGVHLLYTRAAYGKRGVAPSLGATLTRRGRSIHRSLAATSGAIGVGTAELLAVLAVLFGVGASLAGAVFGGVVPGFAGGALAASLPLGSARSRSNRRRAVAMESWPRMIEEIRVLAGSLGRSIPSALFEVGRRGPVELRPAFLEAHREWLVSTDLGRTLDILRTRIADPAVDATCETLLVAQGLGGADLDRRLLALSEDRLIDVQGRKDALAKQAGVRFARLFVLVVPLGMALAGLSIGTGRAAYQTPAGQVAVIVGIAVLAGCWAWASRLLGLPAEDRVFGG
jgi:tight adherence protein B